jgi:hypothetical protein
MSEPVRPTEISFREMREQGVRSERGRVQCAPDA